VPARYVRIENIHVPTGTFALSGLRVFGKGSGIPPDTVRHFTVLRGASEPRNAWLKWQHVDDAVGYTIYVGSSPTTMYNSITVYGRNEYTFTAMDVDAPYFFQIEAFNENGIGKRTSVVGVE